MKLELPPVWNPQFPRCYRSISCWTLSHREQVTVSWTRIELNEFWIHVTGTCLVSCLEMAPLVDGQFISPGVRLVATWKIADKSSNPRMDKFHMPQEVRFSAEGSLDDTARPGALTHMYV